MGQVSYLFPESAKEETKTAAKPKRPYTPPTWPLVGDVGDLARLEFEGHQIFTAGELRDALASDLEIQAACRPSAPLGQLIELLEEGLTEGYAESGCPEATAEVRLSDDGKHLVARLDEGPRRMAGEVRVQGADQVDLTALTRRLAAADDDWRPRSQIWFSRGNERLAGQGDDDEKDSKLKKLWARGEPARSSQSRMDDLRSTVADELALQGYPLAKFDVLVEPTGDGESADLVITVEDIGAAARLDSIEFHGLERHTREELLEFMGLAEGEPLDLQKLVEAFDQLEDSCRFWTHQLKVVFPERKRDRRWSRYDATDPRTRLVVNLVEYTHVPKLGQPLSEVDEILRRAGKWLQAMPDQQEWDIHVHTVGITDSASLADVVLEASVYPKRGFILDAKGELLLSDTVTPLCYQLFCIDNEVGVLVPDRGSRLSMESVATPGFVVNLSCLSKEDERYISSMKFGAALASKSDDGDVHWLDLAVAPVVFVNIPYRDESSTEIVDGVLHVDTEYAGLRIEVATGRIVEFRMSGENDESSTMTTVAHDEDRLNQLLAKFHSLPNRYDPARPISSTIRYALDLIDQSAEEASFIPEATRVRIEQLIDSPWLAQIDQDWTSWTDADSNARKREKSLKFRLPESSYRLEVPYLDMAFSVPDLADELFERETWPWALTREMAFRVAGMFADKEQQRLAKNEFRRVVERDDTGPLFYWMSAKLSFGPSIAKLGLTKLDDGSIEREIEMLTAPDTGLMKLAQQIAPVVQTIPEEDLIWLSRMLNDNYEEPLAVLIHEFYRADLSSPDAIRARLRQAWDEGLRDHVETELRRLSGESTVAKTPDTAQAR